MKWNPQIPGSTWVIKQNIYIYYRIWKNVGGNDAIKVRFMWWTYILTLYTSRSFPQPRSWTVPAARECRKRQAWLAARQTRGVGRATRCRGNFTGIKTWNDHPSNIRSSGVGAECFAGSLASPLAGKCIAGGTVLPRCSCVRHVDVREQCCSVLGQSGRPSCVFVCLCV